MFHEFDEEVFLGPETTVSLHFASAAGEDAPDWDIAAGEAQEHGGWTRHALRGASLGNVAASYDDRDEDRSHELREVLRHVQAVSWD